MLSPDEIRSLCERKYPAYLRSLVTGEAFFPLKIPFGRPSASEDFGKLQAGITALDRDNPGYRIEWEEVKTRRWGVQRLPQRVGFEDEAAYLRMLRKQSEVDSYRAQLQLTRSVLPQLAEWASANVLLMLEHASAWAELLKVCEYFLAHPRPNRYARELPIAVDTKFIERYRGILRSLLDFLLPESSRTADSVFEKRFGLKYDEPRIHLRLLSLELKEELRLCVDDLSVPLSQFAALGWREITLLTVENKKTFSSLPPLERTVGIWGGGGAAELLTSAPWCAGCPLVYWGDLDVHGFHILSRLRRAFPQLRSVMMDVETLERFRESCVTAKPALYEDMASLTEAEQDVYGQLKSQNLLLEQEKLPHEYVVARLNAGAIVP